MINKVLIAEDQQSISKGLETTLNELGITNIKHASYCDNALIKIKASLKNNEPFDLLITDLSFNEDYITNTIDSGFELIQQTKRIQPTLKIIVFSIENKIGKIKKLLDEYSVNGYILKGRRESEDINKAIQAISKDKQYYSETVAQLLRNSMNITEISKFDVLILELISKGFKQKQISIHFQNNNIPSGSQRSIEYRIQELKTMLGAETIPQLISIAKDIGLI